jgi:hypothetical protein
VAGSAQAERQVPSEAELEAFFREQRYPYALDRPDVMTWFDLLDLNDHVSFGGKP